MHNAVQNTHHKQCCSLCVFAFVCKTWARHTADEAICASHWCCKHCLDVALLCEFLQCARLIYFVKITTAVNTQFLCVYTNWALLQICHSSLSVTQLDTHRRFWLNLCFWKCYPSFTFIFGTPWQLSRLPQLSLCARWSTIMLLTIFQLVC